MDWANKYIVDGVAFACEIGHKSLLSRLLPHVRDRNDVQRSLANLALQANFHLYDIYKEEGYSAQELLYSMTMTVGSDFDFFDRYLDHLHQEWPTFDIEMCKKLLKLAEARRSMEGVRLIFSNIYRLGTTDSICLELSSLAARRSDIVMLKILGDLGYDFHNKWTLLIDAVRYGNPDVVEFLLGRSKVEASDLPDFEGDNPIDIAFKFGSRRILDILLAALAPVPVWRANFPEEYPHHFQALLGKIDVDYESCGKATDKCGRTILHCACLSGNVELVSRLLASGRYSASGQDNTGMSIVHVAALLQRKDMLQVLLAEKPDLSLYTTLNEWSPLHFACNNGDMEMVKMFLEAGATRFVKCKDRFGSTPMDLACCRAGSLPIVKLLEQSGGRLNKVEMSLFSALNCNDTEIADFLFPRIVCFNEKLMGMTIVEKACHVGNLDFLERYLNRYFAEFWTEHKALLYACYAGRWHVAQYLIKSNPRCLNEPGPFGEQPLTACLANDYGSPNVLKTIDFLLMSGVRFDNEIETCRQFRNNLLRLYRQNYYLFCKLCQFAQCQIQIPEEFLLTHVIGKNEHCAGFLRLLDYKMPGEYANVTSLLGLSRLVIRSCLKENGPIHELVTELPLPSECQDYLIFQGRHDVAL